MLEDMAGNHKIKCFVSERKPFAETEHHWAVCNKRSPVTLPGFFMCI